MHTMFKSYVGVDYEYIDIAQCKKVNDFLLYYKNGFPIKISLKNSKKIKLTKTIRKELYKFKELKHPNLVQFLGICYANNKIGFMSEYVGNVTLMEILAHKDHELDFQFKLSLIGDLIKGMKSLHQSEVGYHGLLTSRNCIITKLWELKIADFDRKLNEVIGYDESEENSYIDLLWAAPECINIEDETYNVTGYQKGDIYSIGIILNEIMTRNLPYEDKNIIPKDIIKEVASGSQLRPTMQSLNEPEAKDMNEIIMRCWAENPLDRPDISVLGLLIKKINPKAFNSVSEKMVEMLENYSDHLEDLVRMKHIDLNYEKEHRKEVELKLKINTNKLKEEIENRKKMELELDKKTIELNTEIENRRKIESELKKRTNELEQLRKEMQELKFYRQMN